NSAVSSRTVASGVTTMHSRRPPCSRVRARGWVGCSIVTESMSLLLLFLGLFFGLLDRADVHERALGQVVPLAVGDFFEAADRFGQRRDLPLLAREHFGNQEWLRQETFHAAGTMHD